VDSETETGTHRDPVFGTPLRVLIMQRPTWHKSSYSSDQGGDCVEVHNLGDGRAVRDSKNPAAAALTGHPALMTARCCETLNRCHRSSISS
jgi:hypothetical protein